MIFKAQTFSEDSFMILFIQIRYNFPVFSEHLPFILAIIHTYYNVLTLFMHLSLELNLVSVPKDLTRT